MTLYDLPFLNGKKTALGSWGLMLIGIAGTLTTISSALVAVGHLLVGDIDIELFGSQMTPLLLSLGTTFGGLTGLGIGHKIVKTTPTE